MPAALRSPARRRARRPGFVGLGLSGTLAALFAAACGGASVRGPVGSMVGTEVEAISPPAPSASPFWPQEGAVWSPALRVAGGLGPVLDRVAGGQRIWVSAEGVEGWRLAQALSSWAPGPSFELAREAPTAAFGGGWPSASEDARGSIEWNAAGLEPDAGWAAKLRGRGVDLAVLVAPARISPAAWSSQPAFVRGGCAPLLAAAGRAQSRALAESEAFLDRVDAALAEAFALELTGVRDAGVGRDAETSGGDAPEGPAAEEARACVVAREAWDEEGRRCRRTQGRCAWAPRLLLIDRARIGAEDLPGHPCLEADRRRLDQARARAVAKVLPSVGRGWSERVDRIAALGVFGAVVEDLCAPRRRRYDEATLEALQARVESIEAQYRTALTDAGAWRSVDESFHVAGIGPHRAYARFENPVGGGQGIREASQGLATAFVNEARCGAPAGEPPLLMVLVDLRTPAIVGLGPVFGESFGCDGVGPVQMEALRDPAPAGQSGTPGPS